MATQQQIDARNSYLAKYGTAKPTSGAQLKPVVQQVQQIQQTAPTTQPTNTPKASDNEMLQYNQNKLAYLNGNVSDEQRAYNQMLREKYSIAETDPDKDTVLKNIALYQNNLDNVQKIKPTDIGSVVTNVYGNGLDRNSLQDAMTKNATSDINAKYDPQMSAERSKLESLKRIYDDQLATIEPEYQKGLQGLAQKENDENFATRESLNRSGGTVAQGLQQDAANKIRAASIAQQGQLTQDKINKLREIATNRANAERETAEKVAALEGAKGTELGTVGSKAFLDALNAYSNLVNSASNVDNMRFNQNMDINKYNNIEMPQAKQAQELNNLQIATEKYNLNELTNPDSLTNRTKIAQYQGIVQDLEKGRLELQYLPEQLRLNIENLANDVALGKLNVEWFPKKMAAEIAQTQKQTALMGSGGGGSRGGSSGGSSKAPSITRGETIAKQIVKNSENDPSRKDYMTTKGSVERKQTAADIARSLDDEGYSYQQINSVLKTVGLNEFAE